jgi:hypothetical protein
MMQRAPLFFFMLTSVCKTAELDDVGHEVVLLQQELSLEARLVHDKPSREHFNEIQLDLVPRINGGNGGVRDPTLHFLFMLMDNLPHSKQWASFFAGDIAGNRHVMWAHCVKRNDCKETLLKEFPDVQLVSTVYSERFIDLVTPMVQLLRMALMHSVRMEDKFCFVSDSTLPLKPFPELFSAIMASNTSDFCFHPEVGPSHVPKWAPFPKDDKNYVQSVMNGTLLTLAKSHQWSVLRRDHAEVLVQNWRSPCRHVCNWTMPYSEVEINRNSFPCPMNAQATDEFAVLANIIGPLNESMDQRGLLDFGISHKCHTWTSFLEKGGKTLERCKESNAAELNHHLSLASWSPYSHSGHSDELRNLTNRTLLLLRSSPYLFARKFLPDDQLLHYEALIFGPLVASRDLPECI